MQNLFFIPEFSLFAHIEYQQMVPIVQCAYIVIIVLISDYFILYLNICDQDEILHMFSSFLQGKH